MDYLAEKHLNQSAVVPEKNNIIKFDPDASTFSAVSTEADY